MRRRVTVAGVVRERTDALRRTLFGGFAPLIVTWMIAATENKMAPSFYVMATSIISVAAVLALGRRMAQRAAT
jgi:hypothetical protein